MSQRRDRTEDLHAIDRALSCIEAALEAAGYALPTSEEMVVISAPFCESAGEDLPESLRDPAKVLERGLAVEQRGLTFSGLENPPLETNADFAMAARNRGALTDDLVRRMHEDRSAEKKKLK